MQPWLSSNLGRGDSKSPLTPYPPHSIYGQCVTAGSSWSMAQGGPELLGATAWDIWVDFQSPFFQVIPEGSLGFSIEPGDIVFYYPNNPGAGTGPAGHVDVAVDNITALGFRGVDMDWNSNPLLQYVNHTLNGVAGVFRHQGGQVAANNDIVDAPTIEQAYNGILLRSASPAEIDPRIASKQTVGSLLAELIGSAEHNEIQYKVANYQTTPDETVLAPGVYKVN